MPRAVTTSAPARPLASELQALRRGPRRSAERVHDLHRALRLHRLTFEASSGARTRPAPRYPAALRSLERAIGRLRDLGLFREVLASADPPTITPVERAWKKQVLHKVRLDQARAERRVRSLAKRCRRSAPTLKILGARLERWTEAEEEAEQRRFGRGRLRDSIRRARRRLSPGRAHAVRKALRRAVIPGTRPDDRAPPRAAQRVRRLIADLGRLHDLDVALARIGRAPRPGGRRWRTSVQGERRELARRVRRALRSPAVVRLAQ
ncbi:MAG TPA: hypothetical protein VIZ68_06360 [Thermoplasmata archaeon]